MLRGLPKARRSHGWCATGATWNTCSMWSRFNTGIEGTAWYQLRIHPTLNWCIILHTSMAALRKSRLLMELLQLGLSIVITGAVRESATNCRGTQALWAESLTGTWNTSAAMTTERNALLRKIHRTPASDWASCQCGSVRAVQGRIGGQNNAQGDASGAASLNRSSAGSAPGMAAFAIDGIVRSWWPDLWSLQLWAELPGDGPGAMALAGFPVRSGAPETVQWTATV